MFRATRAYLYGTTVVLSKSDIANSKEEDFVEVNLYLKAYFIKEAAMEMGVMMFDDEEE